MAHGDTYEVTWRETHRVHPHLHSTGTALEEKETSVRHCSVAVSPDLKRYLLAEKRSIKLGE